ncbi:unnamed protein product [Sphenostylis stenocarpa]|uniref:Mei2-like C-terminal RNA recognition motif domain-containing protein n=1 Tax=Sphenostylis stenocarpa TaxID=92480 RepID=A0AA86SLX2_9FABA|nr:unnamed protein product [Sphenostylis stenocarpa]
MVSLNPDAQEFVPTNNLHLQQQQQFFPYPNFPTSIITPHDHYYYYYYYGSSFPYRELYPIYYYPTTIVPPPSMISHNAPVTIPLAPKAETPLVHNIENDPSPVEAHAVPQKNDEVVVAEAETDGAKGLVQKQVCKAFISCGSVNGHRSDGMRMKAYAQRTKGEANGQHKSFDFLKNRKVTRYPDEQCPRVYPKKKRFYPQLPVNVEKNETTVMIKNIPSKYTRDMLVEFLDNHCMNLNKRIKECGKQKCEEPITSLAFDFVYLPIDFQSGMNKGYAFVNFTESQAAWKFLWTASHLKWDLFQSHKIREVVSARLQGKETLEKHFETMNFPCESEDVLPVCFNPPRDGVIKGEQRTIGNLSGR